MIITTDILSKAYEFSKTCRGFSNDRLSFLLPEVKSFCLRNMKDEYVKGDCPACGKNKEFFYHVVKKFLGKVGIEIDRTDSRRYNHDYFLDDIEIDECSFGNVYFLDALYRIARGEDLDEIISKIPEEIRKERDELIPEIRRKLQENIAVVNIELERRMDLLRKSASDAILKTTAKFEEYASSANPSNHSGYREEYVKISVSWPTSF